MEIAYAEALEISPQELFQKGTVFPPNRLETRNWELLVSAMSMNRTPLDQLRVAIEKLTGVERVLFAPSCRAAIAQILTLLPNEEIVMPAYTCPFLKDAAYVAGKRIIYVDTAPGSVNATSAQFAEHAKPGRILLPTHIFGVPTDIEAICELARRRECVTIEDAAAAFGLYRNGKMLGTFGDFGVFSFERSKRFPAFRGAAILLNNPDLKNEQQFIGSPIITLRKSVPLKEVAFAFAFNVATTPWLYGRLIVPRQLRKYASGFSVAKPEDKREILDTPFYSAALHPWQAQLILRMLRRIDAIRQQVEKIQQIYTNVFRGTLVKTLTMPEDNNGLLRYPIAIPGVKRAEFLRLALRRGLFLETNYERLLAEKANPQEFPNALYAARNVILLPLYSRLSLNAADKIARTVLAIARELKGKA